MMVSLQSFDSKHPVKRKEVCVQSFTQHVSAFELTSSRANGRTPLIKSIKEQRHDTHLYVSFLLTAHTWAYLEFSVPRRKACFLQGQAREGEVNEKLNICLHFQVCWLAFFLPLNPLAKPSHQQASTQCSGQPGEQKSPANSTDGNKQKLYKQ